jgi:AraC-like DNA-binding protein
MPPVTATYLRILSRILLERGIDPDPALKAAGTTLAWLERPGATVPATAYVFLALHAMQSTRDEGLGCELGLRMPVTTHGFLGHAALSAATLQDAMALAPRFFNLASQFVEVKLEHGPQASVLRVEQRMPLGPVRRFVLESALIGLLSAAASLMGVAPSQLPFTVRLPWPRRTDISAYRARLPPVELGGAHAELVIPSDVLRRPLPLHEPSSAQQMYEECARASGQLQQHQTLLQHITTLLNPGPDGYPDKARMAQWLGVSCRTLTRRLQAQNTSFSALLEARQLHDAQLLLRRPGLSIEQVSTKLGYQDPANFTRAFRRWLGMSPSAWRQSLQG